MSINASISDSYKNLTYLYSSNLLTEDDEEV